MDLGKVEDEIKKDVPRTLPELDEFKKEVKIIN
jgi:hypothetical protein